MEIHCVQYPRYDKIDTGGEDTYFISEDGYCISVFDGVGGWSERGISSRDYALKLSEGARIAYLDDSRDPVEILSRAQRYASDTEGSRLVNRFGVKI